MINLLKKISKGLIISIGTLVTIATLAGGSIGIYYKETSVSFYSDLRQTVLDTVKQVNDTLNSAETMLDDIFKNGKSSLEEIQQKIKEMKDKVNSISDQNTKQSINDMITKIEESVKNIQDSVLSDANESQIKNSVNDFVDVANNVSGEIESYAKDISPQKFSETYDVVTISMTAVSGTILGTIIVTSIIQMMIYKKVNGVKVRRSKVKYDLVKHMNKILKKYPNLKNSLR